MVMDRLIGEVLSLARRLQAQAPQDLALAPWLRERAAMQADWVAAQGAVLSINCAETLHAWADIEALRRIIDNLLANALRYAPGPIALRAVPTPDAD